MYVRPTILSHGIKILVCALSLILILEVLMKVQQTIAFINPFQPIDAIWNHV